MKISFEIPELTEEFLHSEETDFTQRAKETFLADLYRREEISYSELKNALNLEYFEEADGFIKKYRADPRFESIEFDEVRRMHLVKWSDEANSLVFRGTQATLNEFWPSLIEPTGMKGYIDRHPEVSADSAREVIKLAGKLFCQWPELEEAQEYARRQPDPRFEVADSKPGVRGGRLCFKGTRLYFEILWDNLRWSEDNGTLSFDRILESWEMPREAAKRAIEIGGELFSKGLVPREDLPR